MGVRVGPFTRLRQPRPTVQRVWITTQLLPLLSALDQVSMQPQPVPILIQPAAQRWPFADERLVCHFGGVLVQDDQALIGQGVQYGPDRGRLVVTGDELVEARSPTSILRTFAQLCQPQKDASSDGSLR